MSENLAKKAKQVSAILKQLAHPDRLRVLCALAEGEMTVGQLVIYAGASQSWVSQFLARMKSDGMVDARKEGQFVYYRIADAKLKALMNAIYKVYCTSRE